MEGKIRIFLADANPDFLELLSSELSGQPDLAVCGTAAGGVAAYRLLSEARPDVLVTDLLLPGLDGLSLLRRLRHEGTMPRTLLLSAFVNDHTARSASLLGVDDYLPKPCDMPALLRRIREIAGGGTAPSCPEDCDRAVREALLRFGINSHLNGYKYLREGVCRAIMDRSVLQGITKILYPDLAKEFGVAPESIERSIRTAVDKAWKRGTPASRRAWFGDAFDRFERSPSNIRFIAALADFIELEYTQEPARKTK